VLHTVVPMASVPMAAAQAVTPPAVPVDAAVVPKRIAAPRAPAKTTARAPAAAPRSPPATPVPAAPPSVRLPSAAHWQFEASALRRGIALRGTAQLQWQPAGDSYEAVLQVKVPPLPVRVQRSVGAITPEGLAPVRFSDHTRSEEATHFDRARGRVVFSSNRPEAPLQAGADRRHARSGALGLRGRGRCGPAPARRHRACDQAHAVAAT
jgi:hypothetical protein